MEGNEKGRGKIEGRGKKCWGGREMNRNKKGKGGLREGGKITRRDKGM